MLQFTEWTKTFLINAKVVGDPHAPALMAYCGLSGQNFVAGYGRWRDTVSPYAYAINDLITGPLVGWDSPKPRLVVMPKNKGVRRYIHEHAPLWRERSVNGVGEIPEARDEWIRAAESVEQKRVLIMPDYKVFKTEGRRIEAILNQVALLAQQHPPHETQVVRIPLAELTLDGEIE